MRIAVIGTGYIGGTLGRAVAVAGHDVTFGSRRADDDVARDTPASVATVAEALGAADIVILAIPGAAVPEFASDYGDALAGKLVIDATNRMGEEVPNARGVLPHAIRYARAFSTLGGENFANPVFRDGTADLFFSAPSADRATVESIIDAVGLRPIFVGEDKEALIDSLFVLWIELAVRQGRGRHLALRLLED